MTAAPYSANASAKNLGLVTGRGGIAVAYPGPGLWVVDRLDLARVQRLHSADQFRNLRLLDAGVLAILIEAIQQRPGCSGALVGRQSEQLGKMFLDPRHMESLDAAHG